MEGELVTDWGKFEVVDSDDVSKVVVTVEEIIWDDVETGGGAEVAGGGVVAGGWVVVGGWVVAGVLVAGSVVAVVKLFKILKTTHGDKWGITASTEKIATLVTYHSTSWIKDYDAEF